VNDVSQVAAVSANRPRKPHAAAAKGNESKSECQSPQIEVRDLAVELREARVNYSKTAPERRLSSKKVGLAYKDAAAELSWRIRAVGAGEGPRIR
jgi:hypothetical protein